MVQNWQDGRVKLYLIRQALNFREANLELFAVGNYLPLTTQGRRREDVFAFARRRRKSLAIVATPRLFTRLVDKDEPPLGKRLWGRGKLILPQDFPGNWRNVFTGETLSAHSKGNEKIIPLAKLFCTFPVALLTRGAE